MAVTATLCNLTMSPTTFLIRPLGVNDVPQMAALLAHFVESSAATFATEPLTLDECATKYREREDAGYPQFAAVDTANPSVLVGFAYVGPFRGHARSGFRFCCEDSVYIREGWHRRGVGRQLLTTLATACGALGFRVIVAAISTSPSDPVNGLGASSVALHESLGWRRVGLFPSLGWKHGEWWDATFLQLDLGGGGGTLPDDAALPPPMRAKGGEALAAVM